MARQRPRGSVQQDWEPCNQLPYVYATPTPHRFAAGQARIDEKQEDLRKGPLLAAASLLVRVLRRRRVLNGSGGETATLRGTCNHSARLDLGALETQARALARLPQGQVQTAAQDAVSGAAPRPWCDTERVTDLAEDVRRNCSCIRSTFAHSLFMTGQHE